MLLFRHHLNESIKLGITMFVSSRMIKSIPNYFELTFLLITKNVSHCRYASKVGAVYFETSAKLNQGVEEMFFTLTEKMMEAHQHKMSKTTSLNRQNSQRNNILVVEDDQVEQSSKNCCGNA